MDLTKFDAGKPGFRAHYGEKPTVRKPTGDEIICVRKEPVYFRASVLIHKGHFYLVGSDAYTKLRGHLCAAELALVASQNGALFVWPVDESNRSAMKALEEARKQWTTVKWAKTKRAYVAKVAVDQPEAPQWPEEDADALLSAAFGDRVIESPDDPRIEEILNPKANKESD